MTRERKGKTMATVRPFAALRPPKNLAEKVSSLPYDVMSRDEAVAMARGNAHSFLHVCRADIDTSEALIHAPETYAKSRENLEKFIAEGTLVRDPKPCFYVYRQIFRGRAQTGVVGCASVDEYLDDTIKKHELTRKEKERDRIEHFDACSAQTEPVFLACRRIQFRFYFRIYSVHTRHFRRVPFDLIFVQSIVIAQYVHQLVADVIVGIHQIQRLTDKSGFFVADIDCVIDVVNAFGAIDQAIFLSGIMFVHVVAVIKAVRFGVVVSQTDGVVNAQFFHQRSQQFCFAYVIERTCLRGDGIHHITGKYDQIRGCAPY